jgi:hypothetical protein
MLRKITGPRPPSRAAALVYVPKSVDAEGVHPAKRDTPAGPGIDLIEWALALAFLAVAAVVLFSMWHAV